MMDKFGIGKMYSLPLWQASKETHVAATALSLKFWVFHFFVIFTLNMTKQLPKACGYRL